MVIYRERAIEVNDIVAVLHQGEMHLGRLKKAADEFFLENSHGQIRLKDCPVAAPVIQVVRKLK